MEVIVASLSSPTVFDFDPLFKIDSVVAQKDHELFQLLLIFVNGNVDAFKSWQAEHPSTIEKYGKAS